MNEETIFAEAVQIADAQRRTAFLEQACADNPSLRAGVEALLRSHTEARSFLEVPAVASTQPTVVTDDVLGTAAESSAPAADDLRFLQPSELPGVLGTLGHYEVLSEVGRGGLGVVLKARDTRLDRIVAIKVPASEYAAIAAVRQRFKREAMTAAAVSHDHVVTIHAVDEDRGIPYLVMECIDGISLQDAIDRDGPLELNEILRIGAQTARGLAAAHEQGLVHRDIKPANILLENGIQRVKITDFGLARAVDDVSMTQTGTVAGTPQYMSPEQAHADQVDHRSDLFSLGSVLYAMCTGRPAFRADSTMAVLKRVCEDVPKPIRQVNPEIPEWLCGIVEKLLAKRPEDRFQSAGEVADLLNRHLAHLQQPESNPMPAPIRLSTERVDEKAGRRLNVVRNILSILGGLSLLWFFAGLMMPYHGAVPYGFRMPSLLLSIVVGAFALNGARHVARRSSYAWAVGGCIACLLPVSMVWLVALPLGMVAMGTLMRREVKAAFGIQPFRESTYDDRTVVTDSSAGAKAGEPTLVARCRRRYHNAHHRWGDAAIIAALMLVIAIGYVMHSGGVQNAWNNVAAALGIRSLAEFGSGAPDEDSFTDSRGGGDSVSVESTESAAPFDNERPGLAVSPFSAEQADLYQQAWADYLSIPVEYDNTIGMTLRLIPPGEFQMGYTAAELRGTLDEIESRGADGFAQFVARSSTPRHHVRLTQTYYLATREVTVGQFRQFVEATGYTSTLDNAESAGFTWRTISGDDGDDERPVIGVSWEDATAFCEWLSEQEQATCTLPSEAQWEFACRAGTQGRWSFGDDVFDLDQFAVIARAGQIRPDSVASRRPNPFGLYDMHGNVGEWCRDWHANEFYHVEPAVDPVWLETPDDPNSGRVVRGGAWASPVFWSNSAMRDYDAPRIPTSPRGFRVAVIDELPGLPQQETPEEPAQNPHVPIR